MVATAMYAPSYSPNQHKLRTYVVLNAKSSRGRLASFTDSLDETLSTASTSSASTSPSSSPATSPLRATRKSLAAVLTEPLIPDECLAYESYAAVASRSQTSTSPSRDLRWSDISRPRLHLTTLTTHGTKTHHGKPLSQKERRRQLQRARSVSNGGSPNDHLECHALELCFEFLSLADLQRATAVCKEFRDVVHSAGRLFVALYARTWRTGLATPTPRMPRAYAQLGFAPALQMVQQRRADFDYPLTTRSHVTRRVDATYEILNNSLLRVLTRGAVDSARGVKALPVQPCAQALGVDVRYFEVAMSGCGSVGVVSLSDVKTRLSYGYGSDEHVGWKGVSCGYHGNDGDFVYNNGAAPYGGEWTPYGPSWGVRTVDGDEAVAATSTVGCGLDMATRRVFFTLNGTFLGFCKFTVPDGEYAAAVSLHEFNDRAVMNAGSAPFSFDLEGFCASL